MDSLEIKKLRERLQKKASDSNKEVLSEGSLLLKKHIATHHHRARAKSLLDDPGSECHSVHGEGVSVFLQGNGTESKEVTNTVTTASTDAGYFFFSQEPASKEEENQESESLDQNAKTCYFVDQFEGILKKENEQFLHEMQNIKNIDGKISHYWRRKKFSLLPRKKNDNVDIVETLDSLNFKERQSFIWKSFFIGSAIGVVLGAIIMGMLAMSRSHTEKFPDAEKLSIFERTEKIAPFKEPRGETQKLLTRTVPEDIPIAEIETSIMEYLNTHGEESGIHYKFARVRAQVPYKKIDDKLGTRAWSGEGYFRLQTGECYAQKIAWLQNMGMESLKDSFTLKNAGQKRSVSCIFLS